MSAFCEVGAWANFDFYISSNPEVTPGEADWMLYEAISRRTNVIDEDLRLVGDHMHGRGQNDGLVL